MGPREFQRDTSLDPDADRDRLERARTSLEQVSSEDERLQVLGRVAELSRMVGDTALSIRISTDAVELARRLGDAGRETANLIRLATALQYDGRHEEALDVFGTAISHAHCDDVQRYVHFAHQHQGKCLAEMGRLDEAQAAFVRAMAVRRHLGDAGLQESTGRAIAEVEQIRTRTGRQV